MNEVSDLNDYPIKIYWIIVEIISQNYWPISVKERKLM